MALTIIALVIAFAALVFGIITAVRVFNVEKEVERMNYVLKGHELSINALNDKPVEPAVVPGMKCVRYNPETSTMEIDGDFIVHGQISGNAIKTKE